MHYRHVHDCGIVVSKFNAVRNDTALLDCNGSRQKKEKDEPA